MHRLASALAVSLLLVGVLEIAPVAQTAVPKPPAPFPDAAALTERRREAENRALFRSAEPLAFTLTADFSAVDKDRDPRSVKTFPATISFPMADGTTASRSIRIRGRGHSRRGRTCDFTPLRLEFVKDEMRGTVFGGQNAIKLGTHCRVSDSFEQYVLREYTAYRIFNLLTPHSFRARLARARYVDAASQKLIGEHNGMFIEDSDDVAKRMEGRINEQRQFPFPRLDYNYLTLVAVFEYMIGNTDVAFAAQHNVRVVETPAFRRYAVPYDFDYSGLVDAIYAVVDKKRVPEITNVYQRRYIGPCRTVEELEPILAKMRAARADIYALYDRPAFTEKSRKDARSYLDGFYKTIDRPAQIKRELVDTCWKREP